MLLLLLRVRGSLGALASAPGVKGASVYVGVADAKGGPEPLILLLVRLGQLVCFIHRCPLFWVLLSLTTIFLYQHLSKSGHFLLDFLKGIPLLLHHVLELYTAELNTAFALVVEDVLVGLADKAVLQSLQLLR